MKETPLTDALKRVLTQSPSVSGDSKTFADMLARVLINEAISGNKWAIEIFFDRIEGSSEKNRPEAALSNPQYPAWPNPAPWLGNADTCDIKPWMGSVQSPPVHPRNGS